MSKLGENIRKKRKEIGYTLEELSKKCGSSKGHLCDIERGVIPNPTVYKVYYIAKALNCTVEDLLLSS